MTPDQKIHIQFLLGRYLNGTIAAAETQQLFQYIDEEKDNTAWQELLEEFIASEQDIIINKDEYQPILDYILRKPGAVKLVPQERKVKRMGWIKWVAAACILLIVGVLATVYFKKNGTGEKPGIAKVNDVPAPKETRAVITLANGTKVYLDSASNGTIAQENSVAVIKNSDGGIRYLSPAGGGELSAPPNRERPGVDFNTLYNPRGSKVINLTLSDGTKVWLNSESSLKYPTAFTTNTREVEITGEAYFEVKHNAKQPFKVHLPNGSVVEDIGTSFNVNAYTDEADIKTTLIEGSVRVTPLSPAGGGELNASPDRKRPGVDRGIILEPGEQALINQANPKISRIEVQTEGVTAWVNNLFYFENTDIQTMMRQIARWYDVDVEYQGTVTKRFGGKMPRTMSARNVFKVLEETGGVHFKIEGRKVTVLP
jgi:ferric-dicitrate binding protein FerR (iron transport regulator)